MKIVSAEEMRALEREADSHGNSYARMMARAGEAVARVAADHLGGKGTGPVVVLVGPGNNGGDGLVAARYLATWGYQARLHLARPRAEDDADWQAVVSLGIPHAIGVSESALGDLRGWLAEASLVVDALLGTGARPPVSGEIAELLGVLAEALELSHNADAKLLRPAMPTAPRKERLKVLAVDVPSGLEATTGAVDRLAPRAVATVTMGLPKRGHLLMPGAEYVGELVVADIGLPMVQAGPGEPELLTAETAARLLPARPVAGHKGTFGSCLIVGGSGNYVGAPLLAAAGAARAGAGLVTLASIPQVLAGADSVIPEATRLVLPGEMGVVGAAAVPVLMRSAAQYGALLLGPGLTHERPVAEFLEALLDSEGAPRPAIGFVERRRSATQSGAVILPPLVVDADALNVLAEHKDWLKRLPPGSVLTPHPGEMARLTGVSVEEVQRDRIAAALEAARNWRAVVVLKGAMTVIAEPGGMVSVAPFANPALASGGTGDVMSGALAGLLAQGLSAYEAARCAVYIHGLAGELARRELGEAGVLASDLLIRLPRAMKRLREGWR